MITFDKQFELEVEEEQKYILPLKTRASDIVDETSDRYRLEVKERKTCHHRKLTSSGFEQWLRQPKELYYKLIK